MGETTGISWCDRTWSPWIGCTKIAPACDGCYAAHLMDARLGRVEWGPHGERQRTSDSYWRQLARWNREAEALGRPVTVFPSLCDPWDNRADPDLRREWLAEIRRYPNLLWLLLSKRPQNAVEMVEAAGGLPENVALGATCEDQRRADINVPALLAAKEALRPVFTFLSCEPLLGPIDLEAMPFDSGDPKHRWSALTGQAIMFATGQGGHPDFTVRMTRPMKPRLDWVITGGETDQGSHKARPTHPRWLRGIRDACAAAGVPYHHKQNGEWAPRGAKGIAFPEAKAAPCIRLTDLGDNDSVLGARGGHPVWMQRIGKRAAGRLLDGVEHSAMPEVRHGG